MTDSTAAVSSTAITRTEDGRFIRLDNYGQPLQKTSNDQHWPCVLDRHSGLIWEVKTLQAGLHQRARTFSWYQSNPQQNGGDAGDTSAADCEATPCNTQALVQAVNQAGWCGSHDWRLPQREELRALVDYRIRYPGPMLDRRYFPQAVAQFYWSATANASDPHEAWGIGFAFGFDYAYFKSDRVHLRLVRTARANERTTLFVAPHTAASEPSQPTQTCNAGIPQSTPRARFHPHDDGTLTDNITHLRWQRCAVGQAWTGESCTGNAQSLTFNEARRLQENGWRLPSLSELSGIVELRCSQPAMNLQLFPNAPAADFWSATLFSNSREDEPRYWQVQFIYGETNQGGVQDRAYLRWVRDMD